MDMDNAMKIIEVGATIQFMLEVLVDGREGVSCTMFGMKILDYKIHSKTNNILVNGHVGHNMHMS